MTARGTSELVGEGQTLGVALLLSLLGIAVIYSAGQVDLPTTPDRYWVRQAIWLALSLGAFLAIRRVSLGLLEWVAPWLYAISVLLLVFVLVFGVGPGGSWIELGVGRFQPSELAKMATVLMLAKTVTRREARRAGDRRLSRYAKPTLTAGIPTVLVLLQPDLGSAMIFPLLLLAALYWTGAHPLHILWISSPMVGLVAGATWWIWGIWFGVVLLSFRLGPVRPFLSEGVAVLIANAATGAATIPLWNSLRPYQQDRLLVFLDPQRDPRGAGWNLIQSQVAIGSGGAFGQGYAAGPQKRLAFLPERHTDFVFSVVGEELGFVGVAVFLFLFWLLLRRLLRISAVAGDSFGGVAVFCLLAALTAHAVVNIGMTIGLFPVTGLPLPFVSYGGSFLLFTFAALAVAQRTAAET